MNLLNLNILLSMAENEWMGVRDEADTPTVSSMLSRYDCCQLLAADVPGIQWRVRNICSDLYKHYHRLSSASVVVLVENLSFPCTTRRPLGSFHMIILGELWVFLDSPVSFLSNPS